MLFQRKIDRAQNWLKNRSQEEQQEPISDLPSAEELRQEGRQEFPLEKGDLPAMLFAAFITIVPVCLLVILAIVAIALAFVLL